VTEIGLSGGVRCVPARSVGPTVTVFQNSYFVNVFKLGKRDFLRFKVHLNFIIIIIIIIIMHELQPVRATN